MASPGISVIVPVYNAEKYLHRCVDSILEQTYADFEVLLVDDGSTDGSGTICDEYAAADSRVRVFHKENGGVSSARNIGLDNACGEWITFVDADDWIDDSILADLLTVSKNVLLVFGDFKLENTSEDYDHLPNGIYNEEEIKTELQEKFGFCIFSAPWAKLFRKTVIDKINLRFNEKIVGGEDFLFNYEFLINVIQLSNVSVVTSSKYHYSKSDNGLSSNLNNKQSIFEFADALHKIACKLKTLINIDLSSFLLINSYTYLVPYIHRNASHQSFGEFKKHMLEIRKNCGFSALLNIIGDGKRGKKAKIFTYLMNNDKYRMLYLWFMICHRFYKRPF